MSDFADPNQCRRLLGDSFPGEATDDEVYERIEEILRAEGDLRFQLDWDSGGPGAGAGTEWVYRYRGLFFVLSADFGLAGPFSAFTEALGWVLPLDEKGGVSLNSSAQEIYCAEWDPAELVRRLDVQRCAPGSVLSINGVGWSVDSVEGGRKILRRKAVDPIGPFFVGGAAFPADQIGWLRYTLELGWYVICLGCGDKFPGIAAESKPLLLEHVRPQPQRCHHCSVMIADGILPDLPDRYHGRVT